MKPYGLPPRKKNSGWWGKDHVDNDWIQKGVERRNNRPDMDDYAGLTDPDEDEEDDDLPPLY